MTMPATFADLALAPALRAGLDALDYTTLTPIQAQALPAILEGRDLIAQAPTGSGKTAAFGLGLLQRHRRQSPCARRRWCSAPPANWPTRWASSCASWPPASPTSSCRCCAAASRWRRSWPRWRMRRTSSSARRAACWSWCSKDALDLRGVRVLVLDEADRMLDMGFEEPIRAIVKRTPKDRQALLFSATFPEAIRALATAMLRDPLEVSVGRRRPASRPSSSTSSRSSPPASAPQLAALLLQFNPESAVVFCNMRKDTDEVVGSLAHYGFTALALHGDMEQRDRDEVLVRFANRSCNVLVASDVAARGLDIDDLGAVVNYELPTDADTYLHRIGRTGRAGRDGLALEPVRAARAQPRRR